VIDPAALDREDLRAFAAIARSGSLAEAARALGPEVELVVTATRARLSLERREAEIALRMRRLPAEDIHLLVHRDTREVPAVRATAAAPSRPAAEADPMRQGSDDAEG
jgi:DNA-binding transcriptional LysR family regulator